MKSESRNLTLAIGFCVAFYLIYTQYLNQKYPDHNKPQTVATETTPAPSALPGAVAVLKNAESAKIAVAPEFKRLSDADLRIENEEAIFVFDQNVGGIKSVHLKKYRSELKDATSQVELLSGDFALQPTLNATQTIPFSGGYQAQRTGNKIEFWREEAGWLLKHSFEVPASGYVSKVVTTFENKSTASQNLVASQLLSGFVHKDQKSGGSSFLPGSPAVQPQFVSTYVTTDEFANAEQLCSDDPKKFSGKATQFDFIGFDSHYFLTVLLPKNQYDYDVRAATVMTNGSCPVAATLTQNQGAIQPGGSVQFQYDAYFGPKDLQIITSYNEKLKVTLGLGWLDMIARPLLLAIKGIYKFTGNYGIAIILLTLLLKILFFPLARQSAISMAKMKKLNPEMTAIREKYKSDPQRMNREMMAFMGKHKVNPMKGCLPILPQIPVFFALFRVLSASIELRHAPFYGWIVDLSVLDPYYVSPLILGVFMFIQQRMTPMTGMDKTQEKIMMFMPVIFTLMMLSLPSGLVLYMLTNTIVSILQQKWLNARIVIK